MTSATSEASNTCLISIEFQITSNVSKLHIVRKRIDCAFKRYKLHLVKFCHFFFCFNDSSVVFFFLKHLVVFLQKMVTRF